MNKDTVIITLLAMLIATTSILTLAILTNQPVNITNQTVTKENVSLTCPTPVVKPNVTVTDRFENIKNPVMNPEYNLVGDTLHIENVDTYGTIKGLSMNPSIQDGDIIILEKFSEQDLQQGMVIRFKQDDNPAVAHRIVGDYQDSGYVYTSGDNVDSRESVDVEDITHVVIGELYYNNQN